MRRWPAVAATLVATVGLTLAGCSSTTSSGSAPTKPVPAAKVAISPAIGTQNVATDAPITVSASGGKVKDVEIHSGGDQVLGTLSPDGTSWKSNGTLNVSQTYTVTATAVNSAGAPVTTTSTFTTLTPSSTFITQIFEGDHATYGVGMPIELTFDKPITNKAAVEQAMHVTSSQPVVGAWSWLDDKHLDFRPREYWPANTTVNFDGRLNGVRGAPGMYGSADLTQTFLIGDSIIVVAGTQTHHMRVYKNGTPQYDWPISTGRPGHDTPNGTYLTIDKGNPVEMKPSDIAPGGTGYYDLKVPWSVRFTWSGDYLHDAYWSVGQQGSTDVSHGCVNMPPDAARTYYQEEVPGDPVTITGSPLAGTVGDGWTDWFSTWQQLLDHSATHTAVRAGPNGSTFVDPASVPASTATAPTGIAPPNNAAAA
jgi:lipoprotein-anchoring transpeptidase ErfK/SrfK